MDRQLIVLAGDLSGWALADGALVWRRSIGFLAPSDLPSRFAVSADAMLLGFAPEHDEIAVLSLADGLELAHRTLHIAALDLEPQTNRVGVIGRDGVVRLVLDRRQVASSGELARSARHLAFTRDGRVVVAELLRWLPLRRSSREGSPVPPEPTVTAHVRYRSGAGAGRTRAVTDAARTRDVAVPGNRHRNPDSRCALANPHLAP